MSTKPAAVYTPSIKLDRFARALTLGKHYTREEAIAAFRKAGARGDDALLGGLINSLATSGLIQYIAGPHPQKFERSPTRQPSPTSTSAAYSRTLGRRGRPGAPRGRLRR